MTILHIMEETLVFYKIGFKGSRFRDFGSSCYNKKDMAGSLARFAAIGILIGKRHGLGFGVFGPEQQVSGNKED